MSKDDSMEVRIAMLETKVDDLFIKIAQIRHEMATKADIALLQLQIDSLKADFARMEARIERLEERIGHLEERMTRLEQLLVSEFKQVATKSDLLALKAEMRKELIALALGIITVQSVISAAMIAAVVQILR